MKAFSPRAACQRQLLVVHAHSEPRSTPVRHPLLRTLRGGVNVVGVALLLIAAALVAVVAQYGAGRAMETTAAVVTGAAPQIHNGEADYLPARFDEASLPRVPQPGQFGLTEGE